MKQITNLPHSPGSKRRVIPFDDKYTKESFAYLKVIGKGSFGKVRVFFKKFIYVGIKYLKYP